jgi:hypothetical protein
MPLALLSGFFLLPRSTFRSSRTDSGWSVSPQLPTITFPSSVLFFPPDLDVFRGAENHSAFRAIIAEAFCAKGSDEPGSLSSRGSGFATLREIRPFRFL